MLYIPHVPNLSVVNRVYEFAKNTDSYFLFWEMDNSSLKTKISSQLKSLHGKIIGKKVQIPLLFKPEKTAAKINTFNLNKLIKRLDIKIVVNANALLFDVKRIKTPVIYDLVDDHLEVNGDIGLTKSRVEKIKQDISNAKGVVCTTTFLEDKIKHLNNRSTTIENGVYVEKFRNAVSLKKKLGLENKKVFGYIGGVEPWTGIDKACENYAKIKTRDNAMIVVGDSKSLFFNNLKKLYKNDILFCGAVSPDEVGNYFKTIDVGLIPFKLNFFTNNAFPIKALEYGLAGAAVISTPLKYLKTKKFNFITFCNIEKFHECMRQSLYNDNSFDFGKYDWKVLSKKYIDFVSGVL